MKIWAIEVRRFRSIEKTTLRSCGGLNVLIGKNNAGKSNILSTINIMHRHLSRGNIAGPWNTPRPADQFTDRNSETPLQIGIEFDLPESINLALRERLEADAPHLDRSIDQIKNYSRLTFVLAGARKDSTAFLFIQHIAVGSLKADSLDLDIDGINLLTIPLPVGYELFNFQQEAAVLQSDMRPIETLLGETSRLYYMFESRDRSGRPSIENFIGPDVRPALARQLSQLAASSSNADEFRERLSTIIADDKEKIEVLERRETQGTIVTLAGAVKSPPLYAMWLMKEYGGVPMLHLRETREPIGREEAEALLTLNSILKVFVLDVLLNRVVAVSTDPAPDSAFALSFFGRPAGQLPWSHCTIAATVASEEKCC